MPHSVNAATSLMLRDFCIIDAGHFATENPVVAALAGTLQKTMAEKGWVLDVLTTRQQQDPFVFYHQEKQAQLG